MPGPGADASTDQTYVIDWFQNSTDQKAFEPPSDCPMNMVCALPVARSIQSGGVGRTLRKATAIVFEAFAAAISPQRFQPTTAIASSQAAGKANRRAAPRRASNSTTTTIAKEPIRIAKRRFSASDVVACQFWFSHCRTERPGASE